MKITCKRCHKEYDTFKVDVYELHSFGLKPFNFCVCPECGAINEIKPTEESPEKSEINDGKRV